MTTGEYNPDRPLDYSVADYLLSRLKSRQDEVAWYLHSKEVDWSEITRSAERIADAIMKCAEDIGGKGAFASLIDVLDAEEPDKKGNSNKLFYLVVMEALEEALAQRVIEAVGCARKRIIDLLSTSKEEGAIKRARDFLRRVSRTYLLGFDTECIVMCRSALEAQFDAEISNDDCIPVPSRPLNASDKGQPLFDLHNKIKVAAKLGRITPEIESFAHKVRKAANAVVHQKPAPPCDAITIVKYTVAVIMALGNYRKDTGKGGNRVGE